MPREAEAGKVAVALKWVGYATAILSLIAGVGGLVKVVADRVEARRNINALLSAEQIQLQGRDYSSAWKTLGQASQIDSGSSKVQAAQEELAMAWLDDIHLKENETFSDVAEKLEPVLARGVASSKNPQRQADLLAHTGWSYFLRGREGTFGLDPAGSYAEAVKRDPDNPYAQAMWGHWILWDHGRLSDAANHFSAALASNRERSFVRRLQLSALLNSDEDAMEEEVIRVANAIRKEQGSIDPDSARRILSLYYDRLLPFRNTSARFVNAVPPAEHVATFHWLFDRLDPSQATSPSRLYYLSVLQEAAGQNEEALNGYLRIQRQLSGLSRSLANGVNAGIKRLSPAPLR